MESTDPDDDWDSDDMSAGARLMRYNIAYEPRPHCQSFDLKQRRRRSNTIPARITENSHFPDDNAVLYPDVAKLEDVVLCNFAGRDSGLKIMAKISTPHVRASLTKETLTWFIANGLKDQSSWRGVLKREAKPALDTTWTGNRVVSKLMTRKDTRAYRSRERQTAAPRTTTRLYRI